MTKSPASGIALKKNKNYETYSFFNDDLLYECADGFGASGKHSKENCE